jgi:PAS domain S-box-containing protein
VSLARKTLLILMGMVVTLTAVVYETTRLVLVPRFLEGERHDMKSVMARAQAAFADETSDISATTNDYGAWDRTYQYMQTPTVGYVRTEYQDETLHGLAINSVTLLNNAQEIVYSKSYDPAGADTARGPDVANLLAHNPWVKRLLATPKSASGILVVGQQLRLVAASPILRSNLKGPSRGLLVMTRKLDRNVVTSMQARLQAELSVHEANDSTPDPAFDFAKANLQKNGGLLLYPIDDLSIAGFKVLPDVNGTPALWFRVTAPRTFMQEGILSLHYLLGGLCVAGVIFIFVTMMLLRIAVLQRITSLNAQIGSMGEQRDLSKRVQISGRDELTRLGETLNSMLAVLEQRETQFRLIAENVHQVLWVKDELSQKITSVGTGEGSLSGEMLAGESNLLTAAYPEDLATVQEMLHRQAQGKQGEAEFRVLKPDGTIRWMRRRYFPVFVSQGQLKQTVGVSEDITDHKDAEEALLKSHETLLEIMQGLAGVANERSGD